MQINNLFSLDLGTTKFCLTGIRCDFSASKYQPQLYLDSVSVEAAGMYRGMLANFDDVAKQLKLLLSKAEQHFNMSIDRVYLGVAGGHLRSSLSHQSVNLGAKVISQKLLNQMMKNVQNDFQQEDREVLHVLPLKHGVDDRVVVNEPLGLSGKILKSSYLVIDADLFYLKDLVKVCNYSGLEVSQLIAEPLASASVTLGTLEKTNGVALLDIGGGTADGIIFYNNAPVKVFTINIGGVVMTKDLSLGLNLSLESAEECKRHFTIARAASSPLKLQNIAGLPRVVTTNDFRQIMLPRIEEFAQMLNAQLKPFSRLLGCGLILTGGGSSLQGLGDYLNHKICVPTKILSPVFNQNDIEKLNNPVQAKEQDLIAQNATGLGLLKMALSSSIAEGKLTVPASKRRFVDKLFGLVRELS